MFLIVGLGNPGKEYENTPHNSGFMALDTFAKKNNFPDFMLNKKANSLVSESTIDGKKTLLAKPQTFMNNSGGTVKTLIKNSKFPPAGEIGKIQNLCVVHDDIDLPLGTIKVSINRGSAGHKGVESIISALGTKNFARIRIGIQPITGKPEGVESFVLKKFKKEEQKTLESAMENVLNAIETIVKTGTK